MKHINMDEIIKRRRESKLQERNAPQQVSDFHRCVNKKFREVNDQTIEQMIRIAKRKEPLNHEQKLDLMQIIASKSGVHLNIHSMPSHLTLVNMDNVVEIEEQWHRSKKNYFILKGNLQVYEQRSLERVHAKFNTQPPTKNRKTSYDDQEAQFATVREFQEYYSDYGLVEEMEAFRGAGELFDSEHQRQSEDRVRRLKLVAVKAVLVIIQETELQHDFIVNDGMAQQDKLQILSYFPVLKVVGKKLNSFINNFKVREYSLKELIYKKGEKPKSVYFLIRGQVTFQLVIEESKDQFETKPLPAPFVVNTETISEESYFGEEEIIFKAERVQNAKVVSSKCVVLELDKDKFQKLMDNPEMNDLVTRAAKIKKAERMKKIQKARDILETQVHRGPKVEGLSEREAGQLILTDRTDTKKRFSLRRQSQAHVKMMHGHIIKDSPPKGQTIHFSMLQVNPDMYEAVKKKFRRYNVKPLKYEPKGTWDFKKVWKILNLQDVLQDQQVDILAPEGLKFYDCHRRFQQQINDSHSLRPKTTSSNYRTKLQYIAYLQQFNH